MADTEVFGMTISVGWNVDRGWPFAVAEVKLAVPKLVSGRMPPLSVQHGASAMASAEDRCALARVTPTVCVQPLVLSFRTRLNVLGDWYVTEPENWSPGLTGVGEVHRRARVDLVPGVVPRVEPGAVHLGADLLDRAAGVAVDPDPERGVPAVPAGAAAGRLRPVGRRAGERA